MRRIHGIVTIAAALGLASSLVACGGRKDADASSKGSAEVKPAEATLKCPAGNVVKDGACAAVVTAEKIAAVAAQQSRLDELAKLLDQVDTVGAPIELFDGIRQLDQWKALKAKSEKLAALDAAGDTLDGAVKKLRELKVSLGDSSARLANLKGELDRLMTDTGATRRLEDARAMVSTQLRAATEPLAAQLQDTLQHAILPLTTQLAELSDVVVTGCTMAKLSGGGDKMKDLCAQAKDTFTKAVVYVDQLKGKPAQLYTDLTTQLEGQLGELVDAETRGLLGTAQTKVNQALELAPAATTGAAN